MYRWIWMHLPGPAWARATMVVLAAAIIVVSLMEWGFPWISTYVPLNEQTVGE